MKRTVCFAVLGLLALGHLGAGERRFQLTLRVVDDAGQPVPHARVQVSFDNVYARNSSEKVTSVQGETDLQGQVSMEGKTAIREIGYGINKEGFYRLSGNPYRFTGNTTFKWQPWNPVVDVVLKRIKNPVPMYARRIWRNLPKVLNEPFGYDCERGDWVAPLGQGKVADMIFVRKVRKASDTDFDSEFTVTFSNPGDGLQPFKPDPYPVYFRSPYEAPADGYLPEWKRTASRRPDGTYQTTYDENGGYFFRVRTQLDPDGKVVRALYGKIYGEFLSMWIYLNPDGTRNMEYSKENLLKATNPNDWDYQLAP